MIWDLYQDGRINSAQSRADNASTKADRASDEISDLKRSVERLTLACQAMWELLREHTAFTEEMLGSKMQEIDLRDGAADGRISMKPVNCPACGAKSNSKRGNCIMCGAKLAKPHTFEA